jgi:hypothetical protein
MGPPVVRIRQRLEMLFLGPIPIPFLCAFKQCTDKEDDPEGGFWEQQDSHRQGPGKEDDPKRDCHTRSRAASHTFYSPHQILWASKVLLTPSPGGRVWIQTVGARGRSRSPTGRTGRCFRRGRYGPGLAVIIRPIGPDTLTPRRQRSPMVMSLRTSTSSASWRRPATAAARKVIPTQYI